MTFYSLIFKIETVKYDKYVGAWGTDVAIATEKPAFGVEYLSTNATNAGNTEYTEETKGNVFLFTHK